MAVNKQTGKGQKYWRPRGKNRLRAAMLGNLLIGDIQRRVRGTTYSRDRGCYIEGRPLQPSEVVAKENDGGSSGKVRYGYV